MLVLTKQAVVKASGPAIFGRRLLRFVSINCLQHGLRCSPWPQVAPYGNVQERLLFALLQPVSRKKSRHGLTGCPELSALKGRRSRVCHASAFVSCRSAASCCHGQHGKIECVGTAEEGFVHHVSLGFGHSADWSSARQGSAKTSLFIRDLLAHLS